MATGRNNNGEVREMTRWFAIFGAPGTGKSTILKQLVKDFPHFQRINKKKISIMTLPDNPYEDYFKKLFTDDQKEYFFKFQMKSLPHRFSQSLDCQNYSCIDETIHDAYAYAHAENKLHWIQKDEYDIFCDNYVLLSRFYNEPQAIIYLHCTDASLIVRNLIERNRPQDKMFKIKYIQTLLESFYDVAEELKKKPIPMHKIDISEYENPEKLYKKILEVFHPINQKQLEYIQDKCQNKWESIAAYLEIKTEEVDRSKPIISIYDYLERHAKTDNFCAAIKEMEIDTFDFNDLREY